MPYNSIQGSDWMEQLNENFKVLENAELIELASEAETITGTDATKGVTPAGLKAKLDAHILAGKHTVTAGEATANTLDITTGKATATVFMVQIYRSGVMVLGDAAVSIAAGVLTVADGASTYSVTEGDIINWIVF